MVAYGGWWCSAGGGAGLVAVLGGWWRRPVVVLGRWRRSAGGGAALVVALGGWWRSAGGGAGLVAVQRGTGAAGERGAGERGAGENGADQRVRYASTGAKGQNVVNRTNWAKNVVYRAREVAEPRSIDELRDVLARSRHARALGSRHSFSTIGDTDGTLISTRALPDADPRRWVLDEAAQTVTVGGGARYGDVAAWLEQRGWALAALASLPHISVAGAIATGTHGSGDRVGSLAADVAGIDLVTASGELLTLTRGGPDFAGAVVSLGALGIVTRVTLDVEPRYDIAQHVYEHLALADLQRNLDAVTGAGYSVSIFTTWQNPDMIDQVWVKRRTDADETPPAQLFGARPAEGPRHPIPGVPAPWCTEQMGVAGAWLDRLPHFKLGFTPSSGEELQSEYLVPRERAGAALEAVRRLAGQIAPLLQVNEIRTVRGDCLWLSPAHSTDVVALHFTWQSDQRRVEPLLDLLEAALLPLGARPHWGKLFAADRSAMRAAYPRLDDFVALEGRYDPEHLLRNDFLDAVLG